LKHNQELQQPSFLERLLPQQADKLKKEKTMVTVVGCFDVANIIIKLKVTLL